MVLPILISVSPAPGPYWPAVQATPLTNTRLTADRLKAIISFTLMTSSLNPRQCTPMSALPPIADILGHVLGIFASAFAGGHVRGDHKPVPLRHREKPCGTNTEQQHPVD